LVPNTPSFIQTTLATEAHIEGQFLFEKQTLGKKESMMMMMMMMIVITQQEETQPTTSITHTCAVRGLYKTRNITQQEGT
jgi:hypothetical protein